MASFYSFRLKPKPPKTVGLVLTQLSNKLKQVKWSQPLLLCCVIKGTGTDNLLNLTLCFSAVMVMVLLVWIYKYHWRKHFQDHVLLLPSSFAVKWNPSPKRLRQVCRGFCFCLSLHRHQLIFSLSYPKFLAKLPGWDAQGQRAIWSQDPLPRWEVLFVY